MKRMAMLALIMMVMVMLEVPCYGLQYPTMGMIIDLDYESDMVTVIDSAGLLWCFYGIDDWNLGDYVAMLMDDNSTSDNIYDDIIVLTYYNGTTETFKNFEKAY